ncbi:FecCD family ABC transporter permease [Rothia nasimurium]|uniref:FecCD family ABC transporter permease n=1 Tax=Rothia nasimurium TaxID=85336 RepID=UPI00361E12C1
MRASGWQRQRTASLVQVSDSWVLLALATCLVLLSIYAMTLGDIRLSWAEVLAALLGQGSAADRLVVWQWRLPRVLAALVFGAALAMSGAIFQRLTRNPLGSPDIVGFNTGAFAGVVLATVVGLGSGFWGRGLSALLGGLLTALVVYLLSYRGGVQSFRFIVMGLAVSAFLASVNTWFMTFFDLSVTFEASVWGAGSLLFVAWDSLLPAGALILCLLLFSCPVARVLKQLELGDDLAAALGLPVELARAGLVFMGVALTATVTAVAGPLAFIALAAPQIALRLVAAGRFSPAVTALVGALLLLLADMLAQHAFPGLLLPTGAVTIMVGGIYLAWLVWRLPEGR